MKGCDCASYCRFVQLRDAYFAKWVLCFALFGANLFMTTQISVGENAGKFGYRSRKQADQGCYFYQNISQKK